MKAAADGRGVQARGYSFRNECQKPSPWQASGSGSGRAGSAVGMFRKEITLGRSRPRQVKAWLTADAKYRLYVNGRLVSRGPVDMGRDYAGGKTHRWFYDYSRPDALFHPRQERHRRRSLPSLADRGRVARPAGVPLRGRNRAAGKATSDRQVRRDWRAVPAAHSLTRPPTTPARNRPAGDCPASTIRPGPPCARSTDSGRRWWPARSRR